MEELGKLIQSNHRLFLAGPILWVLFLTAASIVHRRSRGKPIFPARPEGTLYCEGWASGHSNSGIFAKVGGAHNCLLVAVVPDALVVRPRFPFNLMFMPEIYGLEHHIPRGDIRAVEMKGTMFGKGVDIGFLDAGGGKRSVRLYLKRPDEFLAALGKARGHVESPTGL